MTTSLPSPLRRRIVLVAASLVLAACDATGNAPDPTPDSSPATGGGAVGVPAGGSETADASATESETAVASPLDDFLGLAGQDLDQGEVSRRQREYQDALVACMAGQGFEYTPRTDDDSAWETGPWALSGEEYVTTYGYGVTTIDPDELPEFEDPNQDRIDAMSPAERTAYHRALWGDFIRLDEDGNPDNGRSAEPGTSGGGDRPGCIDTASEEVADTGAGEVDDKGAQFRGLLDDMIAISERIDDDPRVVAAIQGWRDCMADAGHPFETPDGPWAEVTDRLARLSADASPGTQVPGLTGADGNPFPERASLDAIDPDDLAALRAYELEVASVDLDCSVEHEIERVRERVRVDLEQAFIDEHRAELGAYRDLVAADRGGQG